MEARVGEELAGRAMLRFFPLDFRWAFYKAGKHRLRFHIRPNRYGRRLFCFSSFVAAAVHSEQ
jgi:hypothetical protein